MRVFALAGREVSPASEVCHARLDPGPEDYRQLAALLADEWCRARPRRVGIGGGQGAGKSTLARLVVQACALRGLRAVLLSLDDFYMPQAERHALAARVHPLFQTRGPPGTHDVALLGACMQALLRSGPVRIPIFDKGLDDRSGSRGVQGPFDVVVLEGWCVGAQPLDAASLEDPQNRLEEAEDSRGLWRRHFAAALAGPYAELFRELDWLLFLRVPDLAAVRRWRLQQEAERAPAQRMSRAAVERFVAHYERITLDMLRTLPERADCCVDLGADHAVSALRWRTHALDVPG